MKQESWTGLVRGLGAGLVQFGLVTLGTFQASSDWQDALVAGGIAGLVALSTFFGLGIRDGRINEAIRNRGGVE